MQTEEVVTDTQKIDLEKQQEETYANSENTGEMTEEKKRRKEEMTLNEYEKMLEEKTKALVSLGSEERKLVLDKDLAKMILNKVAGGKTRGVEPQKTVQGNLELSHKMMLTHNCMRPYG
ncbi:hyaluronan/mRNA-binding protein, Stm1 [Artemisia annua]|uniref:Hyaluronan/mRNA-binding protein, Stm1 n=1 Tax=Artemisia annua TaxID=35608 RepID=A0A2U1KVD0_ARTAN|nr:hyaluronan/mRNA-binding protein, Stm1 [Artemisia annua]